MHIQVALLSLFFLNLFCHSAFSLCTFPSILPPSLLPLCLFMLLLLLPDIFRDELQSTAGGKKKKSEGEQFRQRASRFLPSHFHEDLFFSLQDLFFSLTSLSEFHSLYICLCPSLIYISIFSPIQLFFSFRL